MKDSLIDKVKKSVLLYWCYFWTMTSFINLIKLFVRPDNKTILFVAYGGNRYCDSPACLYEAMREDGRYSDYKLVWAFRNPDKFPMIENRIKIDTIEYFITALKARCWITNVSITRALQFKGKKTFYFSTTHTALPKSGGDDATKEKTFTSLGKDLFDCSVAQSEEEKRIQVRKFGLKPSQIVVCGYPKNDRIAHHTKEDVNRIRKQLSIPCDKKVILYAPTWREKWLSEDKIDLKVDFAKWQEKLGNEYVILFRAHHMLQSIYEGISSDFIIDVSGYPDNSELLIASDILVSDYSGIFFEFGVQDKPMFCYAYDIEEYTKYRGLYVKLWDELPGGILNEDELIDLIRNGDKDLIMKKVNAFRSKYITEFGKATAQSLDIIHTNIS